MNKKYVSPFVKKMRELSAIPTVRLLWLSNPPDKSHGVTYVKKIHGELK